MTDYGKSERFLIFAAILIIAVGVSCNVWTLAPLINPAGIITSPFKRILIWLFDLLMISTGLFLLRFRKNDRVRKYLISVPLKLFCSLILMEVMLQVLTAVSPRINSLLSDTPPVRESRAIPDQILKWRPNPAFSEHDSNGWRNEAVPSDVDVVALGDSQTYGSGVSPQESWPQLLAKENIRSYNMAFGGYGPVHSLFLTDDALKMKPRLVIEAFYAGNDLYDSYNICYTAEEFEYLRSSDEETIQKIAESENILPLAEKVHHVFRNVADKSPTSRLAKLARKSRLYCMSLAIERVLNSYSNNSKSWETIRSEAEQDSETYMVFSHDNLKTVFAPKLRMIALNLQDPRINDGLRISLDAIHLMRDKTKTHNVEFLVLLIPTKELVFKDYVYAHSDDIPKAYRETVRNEELMREKTMAFFNKENISFVDSLPVLRECLNTGRQPYRIDSDGHPNSTGHRAIAQLVLSHIKKTDLFGAKPE